eukprot:scaffold7349_cov173-Amphora_coffeaeformis.AAC.42
MQGHTLGGGGTEKMSPEELRRSRLAALDPGAARKDPPPAPAAPTGGNPRMDPPPTVSFLEHDDGDAELQRALAMSLQRSGDEHDHQEAFSQHSSVSFPTSNMVEEEDSKPAASEPPLVVRREPYDITPFHAIMWDSQTTTENDKMRWVGQGIHVVLENNQNPAPSSSSSFRTVMEELAQSHAPWGLQQQHGGPCGVLAAVQAELLRLLLWGPRTADGNLEYPNSPDQLQPSRQPVAELIRPAMAKALGLVLARASLTPLTADGTTTPRKQVVRVVLPKEGQQHTGGALTWEDLEPWAQAGATVVSNRLEIYTLEEETATATKRQKRQDESTTDVIRKVANQVTEFLLKPVSESSNRIPLDYFRNTGGVLLLVMSMVASRGVTVIQEEFDDPVGTKLTAQFGHCSQELMNFLLTGQAVSNVFDNTMNLGIVCRGITRRPVVGYLTQLEALRYCQVGDYYKSPQFPIWVVGSTSHFTVLFGDESSLQETESDKLLEKSRRAFKEVEGADENGFIPVDQLAKVLKSLDIDLGDNVSTLAAHLEVSGASIILWDDFWKAASRLLTGATLESIMAGPAEDQPPPLIRAETPPPTTIAPAHETDEEMAKRLAAEWEAEAAPLRGMDFLGEAARAASPIPMDTTQPVAPAAASAAPAPGGLVPPANMTSDEALAWKLQREWDAELGGGSVAGGSHEAVGGSPARSEDLLQQPATPPRKSFPSDDDDDKLTGDRTVRFADAPKLQFEQYGDSFALYHYNGLRGGTLTQFRVTRLSPEEAVGASIALNRGNASDGSGDLEDVVRTKWPSCMISWGGKKPPYID